MMKQAPDSHLCVFAPLRAILLITLLLGLLFAPPPSHAQETTPPPDAAAGLEIYEIRCASCHGPRGNGDGNLAANLQNPPTAFADPAWRETAVPADLFATITNGRTSRFMPPFGPGSSNPISETDRQHLIATLYSLSTPAAAIERGQAIYQESCAACHGANGNDGEASDLTEPSYWFNQSNGEISQTASNLAAHTFTLDPESWQDAIDYSRTFSYQFVDLFAPAEPIEAATIRGQIVNGTNDAVVTGLEVMLRAFTTELDEALTLTEMADENGRFTFDLTRIPPDWVYIVSTTYNDTRFSSDVSQLNPSQPTLELPIIVYEATSDKTAVGIEQIHLITEFVGDKLRVNELYIFNNRAATLYAGPTGNIADGTVEIVLPAAAANIAFQRAFQSLDTFVPADGDMIQTATGWADTLPLRPGRGSLNLLVQYELPYQDSLTLAHPLRYDVGQLNLSLPDVGVAVTTENWQAQPPQALSNGTFLNFTHPQLAADSALNVTLNGRPRFVLDAEGNTILVRDTNTELIIGGVGLLLVVATAVFLLRRWQQPPTPLTPTDLLQAIAQLDDAHENGRLSPNQYQQQRATLKAQLAAMWENHKQ